MFLGFLYMRDNSLINYLIIDYEEDCFFSFHSRPADGM